MFKISGTEKGILALTGVFLLITVGFFLIQDAGGEDYSVQKQTLWVSGVGDGAASTPVPGQLQVNINTADADELQELPGIGQVLARRIIEERERNGAFRIPEDILRVSGIGPVTLNKMLDYITVE